MSFEDKVQRKKSTRWVRASTANYDGDDWVEEEYYEDEEEEQAPPVPKLPPIPVEHLQNYQETKESVPEKKNVDLHEEPFEDDDDDANSFDENNTTPQINTKAFQNIDLDSTNKDEQIDNERDPVDEYADIIQDDSEEEEDYKPQSSSRFQPVVESPVLEKFEQVKEKSVEPVNTKTDSLENEEAQSSSFQPFPEEQGLAKVAHKEETVVPEVIVHEEPHPEPTPIPQIIETLPEEKKEQLPDHSKDEEIEEDTGRGFQGFPEAEEEEEEEASHISDRKSTEDEVDLYGDDIIPQVEDSEDEDEYVPTANRFKSSVIDQIPPPLETKTFSSDSVPTIQEKNSTLAQDNSPPRSPIAQIVSPDTAQERTMISDEGDSLEEIGYRYIPQQEKEDKDEDEEEKEEAVSGDEPSYFPHVATQQESPTEEVKSVEPNSRLGLPSENIDYGDVSDTDTLHIHDPEDPGSPSIGDIRRELSNTSLHDGARDDHFREHAYLSSIINTPDLEENQGTFEPRETNHNKELSIEAEHEDEQVQKSSQSQTDAPRTLSQYYSSVNDYFDDYADSDDNENPRPKDSRASIQSSGSLSTGSFSIKSESRYRYSKASDRESSFNQFDNPSSQSFDPETSSQKGEQPQQQQQQPQQSKESARDGNLNPALSINFGQWRPDTDSFRDQFISGTAPPLPSLDNYTRNSMGEIVEDRGSYIEESKDKDLTKTDNEASKEDLKSSDHDVSLDSLDHTESTDSESHLNENNIAKGSSYQTESKTSLPFHIPLNTPDSKDSGSKGQYFHEKLANTNTNLQTLPEETTTSETSKFTITKISGNKNTNYSIKQISSINDPEKRIKRYREARIEEASLNLGLSEWLLHSRNSPDIAAFKSNVQSSHVAQAYADASTMARKHTLTNNVGSFLHKRRVFQDTSSTAQNLAKGIFSRGKKMLKNDN